MSHHWFLLTWDLWLSDSISATEHFTNVNEIADAPNNTKDIGPFCVEFASKQSTTVHFSLNSCMYFCISLFELSIYIYLYIYYDSIAVHLVTHACLSATLTTSISLSLSLSLSLSSSHRTKTCMGGEFGTLN